MTHTQEPLLHVSEQAWGEVRPRAVSVHVTLTATKLFSGRAALTKSEELRQLVDALAGHDVPTDAVSLAGASLDVSTGLFTRSSSVTYRVCIHVTDLERLPAVLEVIAECKQVSLTHLDWDHAAGGSEELLAECAARAAAKARRMAEALGVRLAGVAEVRQEAIEEPPVPVVRMEVDRIVRYATAYKRRIGNELGGLDLAPSKPAGVRVHVAYRISPGLPIAP